MRRTSIAGINTTIQNLDVKQRKDFTITKNDTFYYNFTYEYYDSNGVKVTYDFTDCYVFMHIKKNPTDLTPLRNVAITIDTDKLGLTMTIPALEMDLDPGKYFYDIEIYNADSRNQTILWGYITILQDVTDFGIIKKENFYQSFVTEVLYQIAEYQNIISGFTSELSYSINTFKSNRIDSNLTSELVYTLVPTPNANNKYTSTFQSEVTYLRLAGTQMLAEMTTEITYVIYILN